MTLARPSSPRSARLKRRLQRGLHRAVRPPARLAWLVLGAAAAWVFGALASTSILTGLLAAGFCLSWMARTAELQWWRARMDRDQPFEVARPRWVVGSDPGGWGWIGGLVRNVRLGPGGSALGLLAVLPSATLWMFAWRYGWDTSFTKGAEARWLGPVLGLLGVAMFVATMLFLPLARARYATTGSARAFFDVGVLWPMVRRSWLGAVGIAAAMALLSVPFTVMWVLPVLIPAGNPEMATWSDVRFREWLDGYYQFWAILGFPVYFGLRQLEARWYGRALLDAVRAGEVARRQLHPTEVEGLGRYGLLAVKDLSHRHPLVRAADWTASWLGRLVGFTGVGLAWSFVAFLVFASAFFATRPVVGWVNQPLVLVPAFKYVPPGLAAGGGGDPSDGDGAEAADRR